MDIQKFFLTFVPIFVAVDALGAIPIFLLLTKDLKKEKIIKTIKDSAILAFLLGLVFIFVGKAIFRLFGITVGDFMVAGGSLLFILSIRALLSDEGLNVKSSLKYDFAIVPLGTPLIAGPAVLATLILLVDQYGIRYTLVSFFLNIALTGLIFLNSINIRKMLGENGIRAFSKVTSLFLAAIAVMLMRKGILEIIKIF